MPTEMDLFARLAMAWHTPMGEERDHPKVLSAKKAGFASFVGRSDIWGGDHDAFDQDAHDETTPEPTSEEEAHYAEHGEYPDGYNERHDKAYDEHVQSKRQENTPDSENDDLHEFIGEHGTNTELWQNKAKLGHVPLTGPVHATQSHVSQTHIDKYLKTPSADPHRPGIGFDYLANDAPMFVTHEGKLHVIDGHHRVAAALQSGDKHIHAWHYDADKHGMPNPYDEYNGGHDEY